MPQELACAPERVAVAILEGSTIYVRVFAYGHGSDQIAEFTFG